MVDKKNGDKKRKNYHLQMANTVFYVSQHTHVRVVYRRKQKTKVLRVRKPAVSRETTYLFLYQF